MAPKRGGLAYLRLRDISLNNTPTFHAVTLVICTHSDSAVSLYCHALAYTTTANMVSAFICYVSPSPCTVLLLWCFLNGQEIM